MELYFDRWGFLPWLPPDEYYEAPWDYIGPEIAEDNHTYDIVCKGRELAYTSI